MDFGILIAPEAHSFKIVKRAEELGFTRAWFFDTPMQNSEMFASMAAAAMVTSKIRLGTGVLIPSHRLANVAACGLATLNALAPGRVDFGISTGFTGRRTLGVPPLKLADMKEYIRIVQALLRGETTEWDFEGKRRKLRFLNPEVGAVKIDGSIPLFISAFGPKARQLTADLKAHWIGSGTGPQAFTDMKDKWRKAGTDPASMVAVCGVNGCILKPGEAIDSDRVKSQVGPSIAMMMHNLAEAEEFGDITGRGVPPPLKPSFERYKKIYESYQPADGRYMSNHRGHLMFLRPEEKELITADMIRAFSATGTKDEVIGKLRELKSAGYSHCTVGIRYGHPEMVDEWGEVIAAV
jgi:5,10-methylenetetrahydromethanopterin reductase